MVWDFVKVAAVKTSAAVPLGNAGIKHRIIFSAGAASWDAVITFSAQAMNVLVTGEALHTIDWTVTVTTYGL